VSELFALWTPEQKQVQTSGAHQRFENKSLPLVPELLPPNTELQKLRENDGGEREEMGGNEET